MENFDPLSENAAPAAPAPAAPAPAPAVDDFSSLKADVAALKAQVTGLQIAVNAQAKAVTRHDEHLELSIKYVEDVVDCLRVSLGGVWQRFTVKVRPAPAKEHLAPVDGRPL